MLWNNTIIKYDFEIDLESLNKKEEKLIIFSSEEEDN